MASRTEANGNTRLLHYLDLDEYGLKEVPDQEKASAKAEVAEYLLEQTLRQVANGQSPVAGEGRFRILNPEYARKEKGGRRTSDLELEGDLKDSLISTPSVGSFIKYGHEGDQVPKSDGHNQITSKAKAWAKQSGHPKRRYIPGNGQKFDNSITTGIKRIIEDFKRTAPPSRQDLTEDDDLFQGTTDIRESSTVRNDATQDFFRDDVIEDLLEEAFERRGIF